VLSFQTTAGGDMRMVTRHDRPASPRTLYSCHQMKRRDAECLKPEALARYCRGRNFAQGPYQ